MSKERGRKEKMVLRKKFSARSRLSRLSTGDKINDRQKELLKAGFIRVPPTSLSIAQWAGRGDANDNHSFDKRESCSVYALAPDYVPYILNLPFSYNFLREKAKIRD